MSGVKLQACITIAIARGTSGLHTPATPTRMAGPGVCLQQEHARRSHGGGALTRTSKTGPSTCITKLGKRLNKDLPKSRGTHAPATVSQAVKPPSGGVRLGSCGRASSGFSTRSLRLLSESVVPVPWQFAIARRVVCEQCSRRARVEEVISRGGRRRGGKAARTANKGRRKERQQLATERGTKGEWARDGFECRSVVGAGPSDE